MRPARSASDSAKRRLPLRERGHHGQPRPVQRPVVAARQPPRQPAASLDPVDGLIPQPPSLLDHQPPGIVRGPRGAQSGIECLHCRTEPAAVDESLRLRPGQEPGLVPQCALGVETRRGVRRRRVRRGGVDGQSGSHQRDRRDEGDGDRARAGRHGGSFRNGRSGRPHRSPRPSDPPGVDAGCRLPSSAPVVLTGAVFRVRPFADADDRDVSVALSRRARRVGPEESGQKESG